MAEGAGLSPRALAAWCVGGAGRSLAEGAGSPPPLKRGREADGFADATNDGFEGISQHFHRILSRNGFRDVLETVDG